MNQEIRPDTVVIVGRLQRCRRGKAVELTESPRAPEKRRRPLRVARTLALAHVFRELLDAGVVRDQAELADVTGFTRARITQMLDLTLLAPEIQEEILTAEVGIGRESISEQGLRAILCEQRWSRQRERWGESLCGGSSKQLARAARSTSSPSE